MGWDGNKFRNETCRRQFTWRIKGEKEGSLTATREARAQTLMIMTNHAW